MKDHREQGRPADRGKQITAGAEQPCHLRHQGPGHPDQEPVDVLPLFRLQASQRPVRQRDNDRQGHDTGDDHRRSEARGHPEVCRDAAEQDAGGGHHPLRDPPEVAERLVHGIDVDAGAIGSIAEPQVTAEPQDGYDPVGQDRGETAPDAPPGADQLVCYLR